MQHLLLRRFLSRTERQASKRQGFMADEERDAAGIVGVFFRSIHASVQHNTIIDGCRRLHHQACL